VLEAAGALTRVADAPALTAWVAALLADPARRAAAGAAGIAAAARWADLPERTAQALLALLPPLVPPGLPPLVPPGRA
jgi:3-deoxy-D-manno-octulosonic-acid transferase